MLATDYPSETRLETGNLDRSDLVQVSCIQFQGGQECPPQQERTLSMKFAKLFLPLIVALGMLITGCAQQPKEKTAKQEGEGRWRLTRAGVLYSLAREQFENGNLDDSRKTINNALKYAPDHAMIRLLSA